jgi:hypothetical protein
VKAAAAEMRSPFVRLCYKNWPFVSSGLRERLMMFSASFASSSQSERSAMY